MDLYSFLHSAPNGAILKARVDALCKGRVYGESLDCVMLHVMIGALQRNGFWQLYERYRDEQRGDQNSGRLARHQRAEESVWDSIASCEDQAASTGEAADLDRFSHSTAPGRELGCAIKVHFDGKVPRCRGSSVDLGAVYRRSMAREFQLI